MVFDEHKDAVYRFAWRMTNSAAIAEDIAQEVFLSLPRQPDRFNPERGRLRSFLLGITRNLVLKQWRDGHHWQELDDEQFVAEAFSIERREIAEIVGEAVRALPPLQREVLILAEYEELSLEEIARRSEEHTSELQSLRHLVCRLLLEKKNKNNKKETDITRQTR